VAHSELDEAHRNKESFIKCKEWGKGMNRGGCCVQSAVPLRRNENVPWQRESRPPKPAFSKGLNVGSRRKGQGRYSCGLGRARSEGGGCYRVYEKSEEVTL